MPERNRYTTVQQSSIEKRKWKLFRYCVFVSFVEWPYFISFYCDSELNSQHSQQPTGMGKISIIIIIIYRWTHDLFIIFIFRFTFLFWMPFREQNGYWALKTVHHISHTSRSSCELLSFLILFFCDCIRSTAYSGGDDDPDDSREQWDERLKLKNNRLWKISGFNLKSWLCAQRLAWNGFCLVFGVWCLSINILPKWMGIIVYTYSIMWSQSIGLLK